MYKSFPGVSLICYKLITTYYIFILSCGGFYVKYLISVYFYLIFAYQTNSCSVPAEKNAGVYGIHCRIPYTPAVTAAYQYYIPKR